MEEDIDIYFEESLNLEKVLKQCLEIPYSQLFDKNRVAFVEKDEFEDLQELAQTNQKPPAYSCGIITFQSNLAHCCLYCYCGEYGREVLEFLKYLKDNYKCKAINTYGTNVTYLI